MMMAILINTPDPSTMIVASALCVSDVVVIVILALILIHINNMLRLTQGHQRLILLLIFSFLR